MARPNKVLSSAAVRPEGWKLFQPLRLNTVELKNRTYFPPCGTEMAEDGHVSEPQIRYYERIARGGVGLIHVEFCCVDPSGLMQPCLLRMDDDRFIPGMRRLVDRVHAANVPIVLQLAHAGRQMRGGVGPSAIASPVVRDVPRALETAEVEALVEQFARAARRAKEAGFDGIQVHGAHGYLVHSFLSPLSNQRSDRYGGSAHNRMLFATEVVQRIRAVTGPDFLIGFKMSAEEKLEGGVALADATELAQRLEEAGINYLEVSVGAYGSLEHTVPPMVFPRGYNVHYAAHLKRNLKIPVVAVGRINDPELAEEILQRGDADLIAFGRGLIADPDLPNKAKEGRFDDILRCVACNECMARVFRREPFGCAVNPRVGREMDGDPAPSATPKRVLVVGAGPGGIQMALTASARGHQVIVCDRSDALGGKLAVAGAPTSKSELLNYLEYLTVQLDKSRAEVRLNTEVTPELVAAIAPDEVIVASGARPKIPSIPGVDQPHVCTADDVLVDDRLGKRVVVLGASGTGCETAMHLHETGHEVTIIARSNKAATSLEPLVRKVIVEDLKKAGVEIASGLDCTEILGDGVVCKDAAGRRMVFPCDGVVLARGYESDNRLAEELRALGYSVHLIGDAVEPRIIYNAVSDGYAAAVSI